MLALRSTPNPQHRDGHRRAGFPWRSGHRHRLRQLDAGFRRCHSDRLNAALGQLEISIGTNSAAESRIRDADFATETAALARQQVLSQSGVAVLSQANTGPQLALQLL